MKVKHLILVFMLTIHTIFASVAFAWSPLDAVETAIESMQFCESMPVSGEGDPENTNKNPEEEEEEEEPDCE